MNRTDRISPEGIAGPVTPEQAQEWEAALDAFRRARRRRIRVKQMILAVALALVCVFVLSQMFGH